ncbi:PP2C family protein-serine/threonine phosphatase [uncultured Algoriphagus sp.]|mgnify:FL=1|uniref:PP2C family protein-serine/threonine phosphatase n=1 Tax=uncultured Algoriphagus sp. TaxID=417365 RepID=UPI0030EE83BA
MTTEIHKFQRKELQLKSLLEITQAINENQSEAVLLNIFKFTCLVHLNIKALILYVAKEGAFENKISHGVKGNVPVLISADQVLDEKTTGELRMELEEEYSFEELETYLPVYHKDKMLAILFLRRKDQSMELDLNFTQALTNILVVALENKRFARKQLEQEILNREVTIASQVQQMLFPAELPIDKELKAKVTYLPHSMVGGDYYDLIRKSKDEVYFCIADVSGKGISAALLMSNFQAALRTLLRSDADLEMVVKQLNYTLFENTHGERFITFFLGHFNFKTRELTYVNAGHNPPLLCREETDNCESLHAGTTILGAFDELPFLEIGKRENLHDFSLHLYTDGLTEAMNPFEEEYGEERFEKFADKNKGLDPDDFHRKFLKKIRDFSKNAQLRDDLTLLSLKFQ